MSEAAAYTVPDAQGSREILAAVTLQPGASVDAAGLLKHARSKLPGYALPREIQLVEVLPRTSGGKIDRLQLAANRPSESDA